jgi:transposase
LVREGIDAAMCNRFKLGRTPDEAYAYGCDLRFNHLDTTSFALSGEYILEGDEQAMTITHGYSKDHRPDLQQAVLELMMSQDGGVPFVSKSWDGNTSDIQVFQERAQGVMTALQKAPAHGL